MQIFGYLWSGFSAAAAFVLNYKHQSGAFFTREFEFIFLWTSIRSSKWPFNIWYSAMYLTDLQNRKN